MIGDSETDAEASMSASIPFILLENDYTDKKIIEFGFSLPPHLKINSFYQKVLLRNLLKKRGLTKPLGLEKKGLTILFNKWFDKKDWDRSYYFNLLNQKWNKIYRSV